MADEKTLIKNATDATTDIKTIKMSVEGVVSVSEDGFSKKQPWPVVKQNVKLLGTHITDYAKRVTTAEKALKPIKGKKGALEAPAKALDAAITTTQSALKTASGVLTIHEKMIAAIEKSDREIEPKLKAAVTMGESSLGEINARLISMPGEVSVIQESFFAKGLPASAIKQPLTLLFASVKSMGAELTTAQSVAESLAALVKQESSVFESKALLLIKDGKALLPKLVAATAKGRAAHGAAVKAVAAYAARLAAMPKA